LRKWSSLSIAPLPWRCFANGKSGLPAAVVFAAFVA
jgi:hypothetical protein